MVMVRPTRGSQVLPLGRSCEYWLHWVNVPWEEGSGHAWLLFGRLVSLGGLGETKPIHRRLN